MWITEKAKQNWRFIVQLKKLERGVSRAFVKILWHPCKMNTTTEQALVIQKAGNFTQRMEYVTIRADSVL